MTFSPRLSIAAALVTVCVVGALFATPASASPSASPSAAPSAHAGRTHLATTAKSCPWATAAGQAQKTPSQLANEVLAKMNTSQKIAMLSLSINAAMDIENQTPPIPSLCIPAFTWRDGPAGLADGALGVTAFPDEINLASSFDTNLATTFGQVLGAQARAQGTMAIQGPGIDPTVYDNWGRVFENYGSDPYLNATLGAAEVTGIQSSGTIAVAKHYGPYAAENTRQSANYLATQRELQQIYLDPFRAAISAGVSGLMCSYGSLNGTPNCANPMLMAQATAWGFSGVTRTDAHALHNDIVAAQAGVNLYKSLLVGQIPRALSQKKLSMAQLNTLVHGTLSIMFKYHDVPSLAGTPLTNVTTPAASSVALQMAEEGSVLLKNNGTLPLTTANNSIAVISDHASNNPVLVGYGSSHVEGTNPITPLAGIQAAFSNSTVTYTGVVPTFQNASLGTPSLVNSAKGIYSATLTLAPGTLGVVDFEIHSKDPAEILNNATPFFQSFIQSASVNSLPSQATSVTATTQLTVRWTGTAPSIQFAPVDPLIAQAVAAASKAQVPIVIASVQSTEDADLATLSLSGFQNQLIAAVAAANPNTVVDINAGNPVLMPWLGSVAAVLDSWYPGDAEGTALAAILDGSANPSGHLPIAFPTSDAASPQLPDNWPTSATTINLNAMGLNVGEHWYTAHHITPLFPYGYGLSYASFSVLGTTVDQVKGGYYVNCTVTNTGPTTGRAVVQGYLDFPVGTGQPTNNLATFGSITLPPGGSSTLHMFMPDSALAQYSNGSMRILRGLYTLHVGQSSAGPFTNASINVPASISAQ